MDLFMAARWQMTLSLVFHIVFAAIGIGLPLLLVLVERKYLRTGQEHYRRLARTWARAVGVLFAVGAISGTALAFELGLLWPRYMEATGPVVGHLFALEGFAFFLEAIFIGLYVYGWDRVSPRTHWWCGVVIAASGMVSGILILGVNAWMQIPAGFDLPAYLASGRISVSDPVAIFKQPAWLYMALHSTLSCYIAVSFAVAAIYAWGMLRGRDDPAHRSAIRLALGVGLIAAVLQPFSGDAMAKFVFRTQPAKFAAMEGQFRTQTYAPLRLGGLPDEANSRTDYAIEIPGGLSFLASMNPATEVRGLDSIPRSNWPNVALTHASFQVMVVLGAIMFIVAAWFWIALWRKGKSATQSRWLLRALVVCGPLGFLALEAGWMVTEVGRQPWVIQGILRTSDAVTPAAGVQPVFYAFTALYLLLAIAVVLVVRRVTRKPAEEPARAEA